MAKKQQDLLKAKQKKQKMIIAVGGVLLLGLLAIQGPKTLKMLNPPNNNASSSSSTTTTPASTTAAPAGTPPADGSLTPPTLAGSAAASTAQPSSSGLASSDPLPSTQDGQLVSFSRFVAKDPFTQQINKNGSVGSATGTTPTSTTPTSTTPTSTTPTSTTPTPAPPTADPTKATISINGATEDVQVGATFPAAAAQPYFKLVSLKADEARIGIAGGSLAGGDQTVALVKGKKLTLENTADGTRYELQLVATS